MRTVDSSGRDLHEHLAATRDMLRNWVSAARIGAQKRLQHAIDFFVIRTFERSSRLER
jgi:hypothetical protein